MSEDMQRDAFECAATVSGERRGEGACVVLWRPAVCPCPGAVSVMSQGGPRSTCTEGKRQRGVRVALARGCARGPQRARRFRFWAQTHQNHPPHTGHRQVHHREGHRGLRQARVRQAVLAHVALRGGAQLWCVGGGMGKARQGGDKQTRNVGLTPPTHRHSGSFVTHETKCFVYFYLGHLAVLLFKSG